jgi:hypothetical protein
MSRRGQLQAPPDAAEQLRFERVFQRADLGADGLRRETQLLGGARDTARLRDPPEIMQLLVIQHGRLSDQQFFSIIRYIIIFFFG